MVDYDFIESLLLRLLTMLDGVFTVLEADEVKEFIEVGEYGLALDTLIDIIEEESKPISREVVDVARKTAFAMDVNVISVQERLARFISSD